MKLKLILEFTLPDDATNRKEFEGFWVEQKKDATDEVRKALAKHPACQDPEVAKVVNTCVLSFKIDDTPEYTQSPPKTHAVC